MSKFNFLKNKKKTKKTKQNWALIHGRKFCYIDTASKEVEVYIFFEMIKLDIKRESNHC